MFLDDEDLLIQLAKDYFERLNYRVAAFTDSETALGVYRQAPLAFDWTVVDMKMPNRTGLELACDLLGIRPDAAIVLCSGAVSDDLRDAARAAGIREVFEKPIDLTKLYEALHTLFLSSTGRAPAA